MKNKLKVNEIFYSLAGEGANTGMPVIFIRLSGCNKACPFCDTEHKSGEELTIPIIYNRIKELTTKCNSIIFTGGEPLLQLNAEIVCEFQHLGFWIGLETNGSIKPDAGCCFDYVSVSPKVPPMELKANFPSGVNEIRYPLQFGQIPPPLHLLPIADKYYISPIFDGLKKIQPNIKWCLDFCKDNPDWCLSIQSHKILGFA